MDAKYFKFSVIEAAGFDSGNLSNGDFASGGTDWTAPLHWIISTGYASFDDVDAAVLSQAQADMTVGMAVSTLYTLYFTIAISSGTARIQFGNSDMSYEYLAFDDYAVGDHEVTLTTPDNYFGSPEGLGIRASGDSTNPFTITNLRMIEQ